MMSQHPLHIEASLDKGVKHAYKNINIYAHSGMMNSYPCEIIALLSWRIHCSQYSYYESIIAFCEKDSHYW